MSRRLFLSTSFVLLAGCMEAEEAVVHDHEPEPSISSVSQALGDLDPVSTAVTDSCSTTAVKGLATQLVEEIQCLRPGSMKRIDNIPGLNLGDAVFPYLQSPAAEALVDAQKSRNVPMSINSGLRTLPQQYLLYRWYQTGRCGIGLAASPGKSNHESAIAIDIDDNAAWRSALEAKSFKWLGAGDPVHYDFSGNTADLRGLSVKAFQRLWNRNHPEDLIPEDSAYGPDTEKRLARAPANGFKEGAKCDSTTPDPANPTPSSDTSPDNDDSSESDPTKAKGDKSTRLRSSGDTASSGCSMTGFDNAATNVDLAIGAVAFLAWLTRSRRRARDESAQTPRPLRRAR